MKYRKKPVVIEAYQTDKEMDIETLEGTMHASVGDYIITGVRGEQYPCKPDIFEQTYEPADAPTASPWRRVEDELPEIGHSILIWAGGVAMIGKRTDDDMFQGKRYFLIEADGHNYWERVEPGMYWMPIEPPKSFGGQK